MALVESLLQVLSDRLANGGTDGKVIDADAVNYALPSLVHAYGPASGFETSGGNVVGWKDSAGESDLTLVGPNSITIDPTWRNGLPALQFASGSILTTLGAFASGAILQPYSVYLVGAWNAGSKGQALDNADGQTGRLQVINENTGELTVFGGHTVNTGLIVGDGAPFILRLQMNDMASDVLFELVGSSMGGVFDLGPNSLEGLTLGGQRSNLNRWWLNGGRIAEVQIHNQILSPAIDALEIASLRARWDI